MWIEILLLTALGFVLVVIDLIALPGSFLVVGGSGIILYAVLVNFQSYGPIPALLHLLACLAIVPKLVIWSLSRVSLKKEMRAEDGFTGLPDRSRYLGLRGTVHSTLRPSGTVEVDVDGDVEYLDCIAESGFIDQGEPVTVVEIRGPSLVVRLASGTEPPEST